MELYSCDGEMVTNPDGTLSCPDWVVWTPQQFVAEYYDAMTMSADDFQTVAASVVGLFVIAYGVKLIRRMLNV